MSRAKHETITPVSLDPSEHHYGIPLAEDGNPIFFVLPPGMRASYERKLERCARGWRATGDPAFAIEAFILTYLHRQPPQLWLTEAACQLGIRRRTKIYAARAIAAATRWMRYVAVRDAQRRGMSWPKAYAHAAESLKKTGAAGSADTMKDTYIDVKQDLDAGRGDQYFFAPKMPRTNAVRMPGGSLTLKPPTLKPPPRRKRKRYPLGGVEGAPIPTSSTREFFWGSTQRDGAAGLPFLYTHMPWQNVAENRADRVPVTIPW